MADIFISYADKDRDWAGRFLLELDKNPPQLIYNTNGSVADVG